MPAIYPLSDLAVSPTAHRFQGGEDGAQVSFFYTTTPPGEGPGLHWHPYPEVFLVLEGQGTYTVGDEQVVVEGGNVVVVPPETPHGFKNSGDETLRVVGIHPSPQVIQTWLEGEE